MSLLNKFKLCSKQQTKSFKQFSISQDKSNTIAIYFTGYYTADEELDLDFTVNCLVKYGLLKKNIYVFAPNNITSNLTSLGVNFYEPEDYLKEVPKLSGKNVFVYISGHGAHYGVGYKTIENNVEVEKILKPNELISPVDSINGIELAVFIVAQCYAGVFDYWDTYSKKYQMCIVGSTGMHTAVATVIQPNTVSCNIFLYYFNQWLISCDKDLDGDGKNTLLDWFKYAGTYTGKFYVGFRRDQFIQVQNIIKALNNPNLAPYLKIMYRKNLQETLDFLHSVQEPWILNANLAREITL